jgi:predicted RNase H-like HicB family nuclease
VSCQVISYDQDAECFVSWCAELNIYSAGESEAQAMEAIHEAVCLALDYAYRERILGRMVLRPGPWYALCNGN